MSTQELENALKVLRSGGTILYPTDTVWGIGCDATKEQAVEKVFQIKKRNESKSLIVLIDSIDELGRYVKEIPYVATELIECSDLPLTIVFPGAINLAKNLIAQDGSIAIRVVKDKFCSELIRKSGKPLVSTSANISGEPTPSSFDDVSEEIVNGVDYVVNLRRSERTGNKPSRIIQLNVNGEFKIIR